MSTPDARTTTNPSGIANDNQRADAVARRFLLGAAVYVLAATFGWCAVGILISMWLFGE